MISLTSAQLDAWLAALIFPLARILGLTAIAPVFNSAGVPRRIRLVIGLMIGLALAPALPPMPPIPAGSWIGLAILAQQLIIGLLLGLTLRIAFFAVDITGSLIGLQMGLSFAIFYDPQNAAQTAVLSEFLLLVATLLFLAMNGHLLTLSVLAESFHLLPITASPTIAETGLAAVLSWAAILFSMGLLLSLPVIAALLIANLAMGVLSRVAPQLNLFAIGFPVTIVCGFTVLMISLPYFGAAMERLFDHAFAAMRTIMQATGR